MGNYTRRKTRPNHSYMQTKCIYITQPKNVSKGKEKKKGQTKRKEREKKKEKRKIRKQKNT